MIFRFTNRTGRAGTVILRSEFFHNSSKIQKYVAQLIHQLCPDASCCVSIFSKLHSVSDMIYYTKSFSCRYLIDFQIHLVASHIYCRKHRACHDLSLQTVTVSRCFRNRPGLLLSICLPLQKQSTADVP